MKLGRAWWACALAVPFYAAGCVVEIGPDPFGAEVSVDAAWTINGVPANAAECAAAGVTDVRIRVLDGAGSWIDNRLTFPCAQGSASTGPVLLEGTYDLVVEAVDRNAASVVVAATDPVTVTALFGDTITIDADFIIESIPAGTLTGSWTINGATPDATNCGDLGIAEVHVQFLDAGGVPDPASTLAYACATGGFSELVAVGSYNLRVVAVDADGAVIAMAMNEMLTLGVDETLAINGGAPIDFVGGFNPLGNDAVLNAEWTVGGYLPGATEDDRSCEATRATSVEIEFFASDDTGLTNGRVVSMGIPCADFTYTSGTPTLAAGNYLIVARLLDAGGAVISEVQTDSPVPVTAGTPLDLELDFRLDSSTVATFFEWESSSSPGSFTGCTAAGVTMIRWQVFVGGTSTVVAGQDPGSTVACADEINVMSGPGGAPLAPGSYDIEFEGFESGRKAWDPVAACSVTIDGAGGLGLATCRAAYFAP